MLETPEHRRCASQVLREMQQETEDCKHSTFDQDLHIRIVCSISQAERRAVDFRLDYRVRLKAGVPNSQDRTLLYSLPSGAQQHPSDIRRIALDAINLQSPGIPISE